MNKTKMPSSPKILHYGRIALTASMAHAKKRVVGEARKTKVEKKWGRGKVRRRLYGCRIWGCTIYENIICTCDQIDNDDTISRLF